MSVGALDYDSSDVSTTGNTITPGSAGVGGQGAASAIDGAAGIEDDVYSFSCAPPP